MAENMIEVENVTMKFKMSDEPLNSLKEIFTIAVKGKLKFNEFLALDHVSFSLEKGKTLGLIGKNGAGKSTTLKLISGILKPTKGSVEIHGTIVPMLELGCGFDWELTGRENIYLNGSILGLDKKTIDEKYDEILAFSELGDFINQPIRTYSSGMMMRLGFSIAVIVRPEILIVDEIMAVGDDRFQQKSKNKMRELMSGGATVLMVSHNMNDIESFCSRVIWLDHGQIKMEGDTKTVCEAYRNR